MTDNPLSGALRIQAGACENFGSPFYGALLTLMAEDLDAGGPVKALLAPWADATLRRLFDEAVALRLPNAFNHLAQGGEDPALSAVWPREGVPLDVEAAWRAAKAAIPAHRAQLEAFMTHEPQTNEVRRTAGLLGGFLTVATETGLPLRSFEIGASAGLNQFWDRFRYEMGPVAWGDPASPVLIDAAWEGGPPPLGPVEVAERGACDRRPTDLNDPAQRRRLLACIWPDMFDRLVRSRRAIDLVLDAGVQVDAADALAWTTAGVAPKPGFATVLYHSVFWQYLPAKTQAGLAAAIEDIGARATAEGPFAWLSFEPAPDNMAVMEVRLTQWPGGAARTLAEAHPHGAWIRWLGEGAA
ncbi:MAG: DUF2332 family protein [Alphaproteobacteria bacterium]|nr:DUF2332 family protein [Alphaproteobacteria bacterium]MBU1515311.1 DUF2332 family protein [Alphaproteobacteria bacterium]MBU2094951.1 DUF2332 family protein [Alphaproteobacteria bacterium]MBU2149626.1 DUF2332 family protein [Alphaproteobacteria bacterium]MBU2310015.1 DUF2332 family protein [Alphaproteobacteria bacterium]